MSYLAVFLASLAWSGHCVGMCGGFALAVKSPARMAAYLLGKLFTYLFLAVLALSLGLYLRQFSFWLGILAGVLLILIGLHALGALRRAVRLSAWIEATPFCGVLGGLMQQRTLLSTFVLGIFNGFLPCPLVYAMLAYVATLPALVPAVTTMAIFGLGTMPALAAVGLAGNWLKHRVPLLRLSGVLTILLGVVTISRGFEFFHAILPGHCH